MSQKLSSTIYTFNTLMQYEAVNIVSEIIGFHENEGCGGNQAGISNWQLFLFFFSFLSSFLCFLGILPTLVLNLKHIQSSCGYKHELHLKRFYLPLPENKVAPALG